MRRTLLAAALCVAAGGAAAEAPDVAALAQATLATCLSADAGDRQAALRAAGWTDAGEGQFLTATQIFLGNASGGPEAWPNLMAWATDLAATNAERTGPVLARPDLAARLALRTVDGRPVCLVEGDAAFGAAMIAALALPDQDPAPERTYVVADDGTRRSAALLDPEALAAVFPEPPLPFAATLMGPLFSAR